MATSMEFPGKPKKYSDNLNKPYELEQPISFISVPGPQGERGPKGDQGPEGKEGKQGPKGDQGKPGKDGKDGANGKDGLSVLSPSGQKLGWALYDNLNKKPISLGATRGSDGWVRFAIDCDGPETNEQYLPENGVSLYNPATQKFNLKGLKVGSIITIRYDLLITTLSNNTEVWVKTTIPDFNKSPVTFAGNLKYQFDYDMSIQHDIFIENSKIQNAGAFPEILTDNDAIMYVKSIYVSVR